MHKIVLIPFLSNNQPNGENAFDWCKTCAYPINLKDIIVNGSDISLQPPLDFQSL